LPANGYWAASVGRLYCSFVTAAVFVHSVAVIHSLRRLRTLPWHADPVWRPKRSCNIGLLRSAPLLFVMPAMKKIAPWSIRVRLLVMVAVGTFFGFALLSTALYSLNSFRGDVQRIGVSVDQSSQALGLASNAQAALQGELRSIKDMQLRNYMAEEFDKAKLEFIAGRANFWQRIASLEKNPAVPAEQVGEVRRLGQELDRLYDEVLAENEPGMPKYALMVDAAIRGAEQPLSSALDTMQREIGRRTEQVLLDASAEADRRFRQHALLIFLVGLASSVAFLGLAAHLSRRILSRLGGELEPVVAATRRVAAGDLTGSVQSGKAAADSLVAAVETMQERLRGLLREVKQGAEQTSGNAEELCHSADRVAQATTAQSDAAAAITAAIQELTVAIGVMAESAGSAADAGRQTRDRARDSGAIIHQAIREIGNIAEQAQISATAMQTLNRHTQEIARFAQEIKGISEQTNLLSLNAAIEAARAGEAGRGFAVVADEVRKLASHTADTTRKIEGLVGQLDSAALATADAVAATAQRAQRGTDLASTAETAIASIETQCERSLQAANEIVDVLAEQRLAAEQIARNTERVAQMIEQGAGAAADSSTTAREVAGLAGHLQRLTLQFSV